MLVKKQNQSSLRRTSHYYKKKLSCKEQDSNISDQARKMGSKIQKKPKEAKLRAKEARQRKKIYIQRLEERIKILEKEIEAYKSKSLAESKVIQSQKSAFVNLNKAQNLAQNPNRIQQNKNNQNNTKELSEQIIKLQGIQSTFRRLYKAVGERNQTQASNSVNILRERFGVAGEQRVSWIQQLLSKVVQIVMPLHCRLLLEHCQNRQQFYKLLGGNQTLRQFRKVYFDQTAISRICQSRPTMIQIKEQYKKIVHNIEDLANNIVQEARKLQDEMDRIERSMNPLFVGRILVYLDMQRKETQNLQQIFPVNYFKKVVEEGTTSRESMKFFGQYAICRQCEDERIQRLSMFSDEQNFLKDFFSQ